MKIAAYLLGVLEKHGVRHIFGNPGTTEIPLVRACEGRAGLQYVVALSEVAAVPMADGYARARRAFGVVNLHVAPGLGNGMGNLYTAGIAGTPLLVLVGGQDRRFLHTNPILWGPLARMAGSICKAVHSLQTGAGAAATLQRALRDVLTPPYAPVALICPPDLLEEQTAARPAAARAGGPTALSSGDAARYARFLCGARRPALIAAEDAHWDSAAGELSRLAAELQAPVYVAPYTGVLPVSSKASCYAGYLPPSFAQIAERLAAHDALLFVGGRGLRTTLYSAAKFPQRMAWLGHNAAAQAPSGRFELARVAALRASLERIRSALKTSPRRRTSASLRPPVALPGPHRRLHPTRAVHALLERFGDAIWVDESGLSTSDVRQWMSLLAGEYLINGSGGIGWGLAAAVGAALARPTRQVVAVVGDGSALYASEALWTAGHQGTKLLLVVFSNRRYATLNAAAGKLAGGALRSFTIEPPALDFSGLATLYGFRYATASTERELASFLGRVHGGVPANTLLELKLDPGLEPVTASRHF